MSPSASLSVSAATLVAIACLTEIGVAAGSAQATGASKGTASPIGRDPAPQDANPATTTAPAPMSPAAAAHAHEDELALQAWSTLSAAEKRDATDYFALETSRLSTFQASLIQFVFKAQDRDLGLWSRATPPPVFSAKEHTPENDIPRHDLGADSAVVKEFKKVVFRRVPERRLASSWVYDYATRELRSTGDWKDPERIFRNGLAGFAPHHDLVEALVERALDDGSEQKALAAFGHAYTDRTGGVFTGITLYDAWTSHTDLEMPDVDNLGIVHTVLGDWKTWHAPVPAPQQEPLYNKVGEIYLAAHHHRGLRNAIARCYLSGTPVLRDQYDAQLENFQVLWDENHSTPEELAKKLPGAAQWAAFLDELYKRCHEDPKLYEAGTNRRLTLDRDAGNVRDTMIRVLEEFGAHARAAKGEKAPPEPKKNR